MPKIALIQPAKSYAPELRGLADYLSSSSQWSYETVPEHLDFDLRGFDAFYSMMGVDPWWVKRPPIAIHDYASLATGNFPRAKDGIKRLVNRRPNYRLFLNDFVRDRMGFNDQVPWGHRDMGVPASFLEKQVRRGPEYDLGYAGSISRSRGTDRLIERAISLGSSILLIGEPESEIYGRYSNAPGVHFCGRMSQEGLKEALLACRVAVNYTPRVHPFDSQTSTKVLEYLALGLDVASSDSAWLRSFLADKPRAVLPFSRIEEFDLKSVDEYRFCRYDMGSYSWSTVWSDSGLGEFLATLH